MARPQTFNKTDVIDVAMRLFWSQGYVDTGMSQILEVTQLKPGSFYNAFSNKKALFINALEHYNEHVMANRIARYLNAEDPLEAIELFFMSPIDPGSTQKMEGCLLTNTATEMGQLDPDINRVVWSGMSQVKQALKRRIVEAKEKGLLDQTVEPEETALHLLSCLQGMGVIGRLTRDKKKLRSLVRTALMILRRPVDGE